MQMREHKHHEHTAHIRLHQTLPWCCPVELSAFPCISMWFPTPSGSEVLGLPTVGPPHDSIAQHRAHGSHLTVPEHTWDPVRSNCSEVTPKGIIKAAQQIIQELQLPLCLPQIPFLTLWGLICLSRQMQVVQNSEWSLQCNTRNHLINQNISTCEK